MLDKKLKKLIEDTVDLENLKLSEIIKYEMDFGEFAVNYEFCLN